MNKTEFQMDVMPRLMDLAEAFDRKPPSDAALRIWREARGDYLRMALERSLVALGRDQVDLYQVHWPVPGVPPDDTMGTLRDLQARTAGRMPALRLQTTSRFESFDQAARLAERW